MLLRTGPFLYSSNIVWHHTVHIIITIYSARIRAVSHELLPIHRYTHNSITYWSGTRPCNMSIIIMLAPTGTLVIQYKSSTDRFISDECMFLKYVVRTIRCQIYKLLILAPMRAMFLRYCFRTYWFCIHWWTYQALTGAVFIDCVSSTYEFHWLRNIN